MNQSRRLQTSKLTYCSPSPLISILKHLHQHPSEMPPKIHILYTHRMPDIMRASHKPKNFKPNTSSFLFLPRLIEMFSTPPFSSNLHHYKASFHITPEDDKLAKHGSAYVAWKVAHLETIRKDGTIFDVEHDPVDVKFGRITEDDLKNVAGDDVEERKGVVAYVCGPPEMTDWAVEKLSDIEGVDRDRILCEKWW